MSSTTQVEGTEAPAERASDGEHPFRGLKDGWRPIPRAGGPPAELLTRLEIVLDPDRSAWVLQQAARAAIDFESYVKSLIDAARAADCAAPRPAGEAAGG